MIVLIDNYDSFTYNIYQMISALIEDKPGAEIRVIRHDEMMVKELEALKPSHLIISPGPGRPVDGGISVPAIKAFSGKIPILGVCLGHQCLAAAFGAKIVQSRNIVHGKVEPIAHDGKGLLRNLPNPARFTRYHSLAVDPSTVPDELEITSRSVDGEIMGLRHKVFPIEGVQFHPESLGSDHGERLFFNFIHWRREPLERQVLLNKVLASKDLERDEARDFMDELTEGFLEDAYMGAMFAGLAAKGVSAGEVAACVSVLVEKRRSVDLGDLAYEVLDTCGTGGDGRHSFNISSFSALLAASCGAKVAKHGNKAVSSRSGSTDFFAALGLAVDLDPQGVKASLLDEGFAYMAAPLYHEAMRHAGPVRQALGIKTIMNCLGPLANPAAAAYQLIGVYDEALLPVMARAAKLLGVKRVWALRSEDGFDEISSLAPTRIFKIDERGRESQEVFHPSSLHIKANLEGDLSGGDATENAAIAWKILRGEGPEALREALCLNAGAALTVAGISDDLASGYKEAKAALDDGRAAAKVEALRRRRNL